MDAFNALSAEMKLLLVAGCGAMVMAFASSDKKREKQYALVAGVLLLAAALLFSHASG